MFVTLVLLIFVFHSSVCLVLIKRFIELCFSPFSALSVAPPPHSPPPHRLHVHVPVFPPLLPPHSFLFFSLFSLPSLLPSFKDCSKVCATFIPNPSLVSNNTVPLRGFLFLRNILEHRATSVRELHSNERFWLETELAKN